MRGRFFSAVLLIWAILPFVPLHAQDSAAAPPGHVFFPDLSDEMRDFFMANLFLRREQKRLVYHKVTADDDNLVEVWRGADLPQVSADISKFVLRFRLDPNYKNVDKRPDTFDLAFDFKETWFTVKTSSPRERKYRGGMSFGYEDGRFWNVFLDGEKGTGMVIFVPPLARHEPGNSMLLCPRTLDHVAVRSAALRERKQARFVDSHYRLSRAIFAPSANVRASALSGGRVGMARATILTSLNISRSAEYSDAAYMRDPKIVLEYRPQRDEITPEEADDGTITGGIIAQAELQRQSGFKRIMSVREQVWLREVTLDESQEMWAIGAGRFLVPTDPGICYIFMKATEVEHKYAREPLVLPERAKQAEEFGEDGGAGEGDGVSQASQNPVGAE